MFKTKAIVWPLVSLAFVAPRGATSEELKPVRVYTNEDLERVRPFRDQTGVASKPSVVRGSFAAPDRETPRRFRGEDYWRREADRVRDKVRGLEAQAADLRLRIEVARRPAAGRRPKDPSVPALEARLAALEREGRELQSRFEDRARREGALPGWLR